MGALLLLPSTLLGLPRDSPEPPPMPTELPEDAAEEPALSSRTRPPPAMLPGTSTITQLSPGEAAQ